MILLEKDGCALAREASDITFTARGARLTIPLAEYWAVATDFDGRLPSKWAFGAVGSAEPAGEGVILSGRIALPHGELTCTDSCEIADGMLTIRRRWHYAGQDVDRITLSYRFRLAGAGARVLIPGVMYYGNPSGRKTPGVPFLDGIPGEMAYFEEHRLPMPFVFAESAGGGTCAAVHFLPSPVPRAAREDTWWSAGVRYGEDYVELGGFSGFVSCNGHHGSVKTGQRQLSPLPGDGMGLLDGMIVEKSFSLQCLSGFARGGGFVAAVETALRRHPVPALPVDGGELIRRKYRHALARDYQNGRVAGSLFRDAREAAPSIVYGWCGRSETLGFAAPWIGPKCGDSQADARAEKYFDFLASSPMDEQGFHVEYHAGDGTFAGQDFVSQGQTMETFAMALQALKAAGRPVRQSWLDFLDRVCCSFHARVMRDDWQPLSTNEAFLGAPLAMASRLLDRKEFATAALKIADAYMARHLTMDEPYWGGTLDASCEDKEGAVAAMTAFYAAWELSGDRKYLQAVRHATAVFLSYLQVWDIPMPPGRLADNGFRSAGWTAVSVQNMHLDVFGVWVAPLLWKIGRDLDEPSWQALALPMILNCGQLTDIHGSQGEQIEQTNFSQRPSRRASEALRGGYSENWTVFWITAAFLNAAAQFELLGLSLFEQGK